MLFTVPLALALFHADPGANASGDRLIRSRVISRTVISSSSDEGEAPLPINIGPTHYHPTVAYVPYQGPSASIPKSRPVASAPRGPMDYDLVVHSPARSMQASPTRQVHVVSKFAESSSNNVESTAPRLRSAVEIPVPDDLTLIQPKAIALTSPASATAGAQKVKTSIPRIERILGVDSSNLPITTSADSQKAVDSTVKSPLAVDEIPVPTIGS